MAAGQVLGVLVARAVERHAHRPAQPVRGEAGREPVDGHDPPDVEQVRGVGRLELRALEDQVAVAVLDLARHQEQVARPDPLLDVPAAEPGRASRSRCRRSRCAVVTWTRRRQVCWTEMSMTLTCAEATRPVVEVAEVGERPELAQVVVPPGQVEQQVADGVDAQPPRDPPQARRPAGCRTGRPGDASSSSSVARRAPATTLGRSERLPLAGADRLRSALTRRRPGTGSAAGRRGPPRRPRRARSRGPCARASRPRRASRVSP